MPGLLSTLTLACILAACAARKGANVPRGTLSAPVYTSLDDVSWAVTSSNVSGMLGGHIPSLYSHFMDGCKAAAEQSAKRFVCEDEEIFRLDMNTYQPSSVYNFTQVGYQKIKAPLDLYKLIREFYDKNRGKDETEWKSLNTYHNMWESPPTFMTINDDRFEGGGLELQDRIWNAAKTVLQEWSGQELSPVSLYGVRLYHNGSILAPHVDRFPLIISAIINVDQDVDEPWPLEVYGHDGKAVNVTMEPGDMVLYESHSVIHGRPFPLKGNYYANIFVHFEAVAPLDPNVPSNYDPELDLPPYLIPESRWEATWRHQNPDGWKGRKLNARKAAQRRNLEVLEKVAELNPSAFLVPDDLGWTPFHEAIRSGDLDCVEVILYAGNEMGDVDRTPVLLNLRTFAGLTPLDLARTYLSEDHPVTQLLIGLGGIDKNAQSQDEL